MRVSKSVRNYIEKQVEAKMRVKYQRQIDEETAKETAVGQFHKDMLSAIADLMNKMSDKVVAEHSFMKKIDRDLQYSLRYNISSMVMIDPDAQTFPVRRMMEETNSIVENIIVTLELGGNKADLERMLAEIVVEA